MAAATVTYRKAGVDIEAADRALARLQPLIRSTHGPEVLKDRGQFAGLFRLPWGRWRDPVFVSSTDGVGTKLKIAQLLDRHESIGVDVVAMNTNDVLAYGARPLWFLDYVAVGTLQAGLLGALLRGIVRGCRQSGCALIGGETAEMPGVYRRGEYDVAGFCVGVVERRRLIDGRRVVAGDVVVGLASSGVHANGLSLVRRVLTRAELKRFARQLLIPTRIYVKPVLAALERGRVHAIAHVTGGGLSRRLASLVATRADLRVQWSPGAWPVPRLFSRIQRAGRLTTDDMYATFNMGIGMALACPASDAPRLIHFMRQQRIAAWPIGMIVRR